jgi:hypothetical protein
MDNNTIIPASCVSSSGIPIDFNVVRNVSTDAEHFGPYSNKIDPMLLICPPPVLSIGAGAGAGGGLLLPPKPKAAPKLIKKLYNII